MPTEGLLDACQALLEQRAAIAAVLDQLGPSWRDTRSALNELSGIVGDRTRTLWSVLLMPRRFGGEDDGVLRRRVAQEPVRQVHAGKHFSHAVNEVALLPALVPHWEDGDGNPMGTAGMIIIVPEGPHTVRATFRLRCGVGRHEVCVVGEFNDWSSTANPMTFDGYCYVAEIVIPTGHAYRFRYLIDNDRWHDRLGSGPVCSERARRR